MIKLIGGEYSINKEESQLKSTKDVLDSIGVKYEHIETIESGKTWNILDVIEKHKHNLNKNDLIVIDNFSHHDGNPHKVLDNFKDLNFFIFYFDLANGITQQDLYDCSNFSNKNYKVSIPTVFKDTQSIFNYYSWNYVQSDDFKYSKYLFDSFSTHIKEKKFIAPFGFLRWDRYLTYEFLVKNNYINSGWVSFSMKYNYGETDWAYFNNQLEHFNVTNSDIDFKLLEETKNKIPFSFDRIKGIDYLNKNPRLELLHRHNSYVGIINDTSVDNKIPFYTSEKLWKSFCTFQFPFIIGNVNTYNFLKNMGFDLFEDIFELDLLKAPKPPKDLVKYQLKSLNNFLKKDKIEIHEIYMKSSHRLLGNYTNMIKYSKIQEESLKKIML